MDACAYLCFLVRLCGRHQVDLDHLTEKLTRSFAVKASKVASRSGDEIGRYIRNKIIDFFAKIKVYKSKSAHKGR